MRSPHVSPMPRLSTFRAAYPLCRLSVRRARWRWFLSILAVEGEGLCIERYNCNATDHSRTEKAGTQVHRIRRPRVHTGRRPRSTQGAGPDPGGVQAQVRAPRMSGSEPVSVLKRTGRTAAASALLGDGSVDTPLLAMSPVDTPFARNASCRYL